MVTVGSLTSSSSEEASDSDDHLGALRRLLAGVVAVVVEPDLFNIPAAFLVVSTPTSPRILRPLPPPPDSLPSMLADSRSTKFASRLPL